MWLERLAPDRCERRLASRQIPLGGKLQVGRRVDDDCPETKNPAVARGVKRSLIWRITVAIPLAIKVLAFLLEPFRSLTD